MLGTLCCGLQDVLALLNPGRLCTRRKCGREHQTRRNGQQTAPLSQTHESCYAIFHNLLLNTSTSCPFTICFAIRGVSEWPLHRAIKLQRTPRSKRRRLRCKSMFLSISTVFAKGALGSVWFTKQMAQGMTQSPHD